MNRLNKEINKLAGFCDQIGSVLQDLYETKRETEERIEFLEKQAETMSLKMLRIEKTWEPKLTVKEHYDRRGKTYRYYNGYYGSCHCGACSCSFKLFCKCISIGECRNKTMEKRHCPKKEDPCKE
jgi:hypothetical protein